MKLVGDSEIQAFILAGGLSSRMGEDKSALKLDGRTLLEIAEAKVAELGLTGSVICEDIVPRCGPLGGMITGLDQCSSGRLLFLPCDMPFISADYLRRFCAQERACADQDGLAGFPMIIPKSVDRQVRQLYSDGEFSLQKLVRKLDLVRIPSSNAELELFNVNTPEDFEHAQRIIAGE